MYVHVCTDQVQIWIYGVAAISHDFPRFFLLKLMNTEANSCEFQKALKNLRVVILILKRF